MTTGTVDGNATSDKSQVTCAASSPGGNNRRTASLDAVHRRRRAKERDDEQVVDVVDKAVGVHNAFRLGFYHVSIRNRKSIRVS